MSTKIVGWHWHILCSSRDSHVPIYNWPQVLTHLRISILNTDPYGAIGSMKTWEVEEARGGRGPAGNIHK